MRTNTRLILASALLLALAACGGETAETTTSTAETTTTEAETTTTTSSTTTTTMATTTTTEATTTTAAPDASACLVGTWELDSQAFVDSIVETVGEAAAGTDAEFISGSYTVTLGEDGSFESSRDEWMWSFSTADGEVVFTFNGSQSGSYSVEGDTMTVTTDTSQVDVSAESVVDGQRIEIPTQSFENMETDAFAGSATFTCEGDTLVTETEGITATFTRG